MPIPDDQKLMLDNAKELMVEYCIAQVKRLQALQEQLDDDDRKSLGECISLYEAGKVKTQTLHNQLSTQPKVESRSPAATGLALASTAATTLALFAGAAVGVGLLVVAASAGYGSKKMNDAANSVEGRIKEFKSVGSEPMKVIANAESKTIQLFEQLEKKYENNQVKKGNISKEKEQFKTESRHFWKKVALVAYGVSMILTGAVILGLSHGVSLPISAKLISHGVATASAAMGVFKFGVGAASCGAAVYLHQDKKVSKLEKQLEEGKPPTETTGLINGQQQ